MEQKVFTSEQWKLTAWDFLSGMKLTVLVPVLSYAAACIGKGGISSIDWPTLGNVAAGTFIAYVIKKLSDKPKTVITASNNDQAKLTTENVKDAL